MKSLPDILAKNLRVIFCGINPGQTSAAQGHHFSNASNRFWWVGLNRSFTLDALVVAYREFRQALPG